MRKLLPILLLTLTCPAWATWSLLHANTCNTTCSDASTTCAVTVASTTAGSTLAVVVYTVNSLTVTGSTGGTFVHCPSCAGGTSGTGFMDGGYILSATGGTTSATVTISGTTSTTPWLACILEYSSSLGTAIFDTSNSTADTTCTTCAAPALTLSGSNDLIIQAVTCTNTCATSATAGFIGASPYTNPAVFPGGDGLGGGLNVTSYTAPNWSQSPTGAVRVLAMAFKETGGGGGVVTRGKAVIY